MLQKVSLNLLIKFEQSLHTDVPCHSYHCGGYDPYYTCRSMAGVLQTLHQLCGSQLKLTSILSSTIFMLIIYCVLDRRASRGNRGSHEPKSRLLCSIGDYSFGIYLVHMMFLKGLQHLEFYSAIPYPITSMIVLSVSLIFCYACTAVMGKRVGRWLGFV